MCKIALLFAAYNGEHFISKQINTIQSQELCFVTFFISIDVSNDNTEQIINDFSSSNNNFCILPGGVCYGDAAKNFFRLIRDVEFSAYDFIAFADQDDIWNIDKLSRAVSELKRTESDAYSSNVTAFWPNGKTRLINKAQSQVQWDYLFESAGPGCTFVLTKLLALELQAFVRGHQSEMQSVWLHDWFTYAFARAHGYRWTIDSQSTMQYRQHANNQVGVNLGFKALKHRAKFILSGQWFKQVALIANLVGKQNTDFVKSWYPFSRMGFLRLAFQAHKCRRKRSEQVWFFCICLLMSLLGMNKKQK
jgi:rhamnosyltransferase